MAGEAMAGKRKQPGFAPAVVRRIHGKTQVAATGRRIRGKTRIARIAHSKAHFAQMRIHGKGGDPRRRSEFQPVNPFSEDKKGLAQLPEISRARMAMSPAVLGTMPCREQQQSQLFNHLSAAIRQGGSKKVLYVSGMPGTGKTASVLQVEAQLKQKFAFVHINAMCLGKPSAVFGEVWRQLREAGLAQERCSAAAAEKQVEGFFLHRATQQVVVLLIDELDCLATRNQAILYRILSLIMLPKPHLVMVAISNNIDLPERLLPKVSTRLGFDRVDFRTYTRDQIHEILRKRLEVHKALDTFTNDTLKYCAARVAGHSGDVRKALQLCKRALDVCRQLPVTIQDLRAADQDLLQANPCVKAVHGLSVKPRLFLLSLLLEMRDRQAEQVRARQVSLRYAKLTAARRRAAKELPDQYRSIRCADEALDLMDRLEACTLLTRNYMMLEEEDGLISKDPHLSLSSLELDDLSVALRDSETDPFLIELLPQ